MKITRYNGNLLAFASSALSTERTVFGDVTQSDVLTDNITADFFRGWGIVGVSEEPTKQDFNALGYTVSQLHAYIHQMGVPEWDVLQEYHTDSLTNRNGVLYFSQLDSNVGNDPELDAGTNWLPLQASTLGYDNTTSGLTATIVQDAIDELASSQILAATITPATDADVTLTAAQYSRSRLVLVDGAWTTGRNIIVPDESRRFYVDNSAGSYTATVKTAAGTGIAVSAGQAAIVICDGTNVIDPITSVATPTITVRGTYRNLTVVNNATFPAYQLDVACDEIILQDTSGSPLRVAAFTDTVDVTVSGAGGLDTGTEAVSTWYHAYVIDGGAASPVALLSTNASTPTLPSGYTHWAYVGAVYNDSAGNFIGIDQKDRRVTLTPALAVIDGATTASAWTGFSCAAFYPTTAKRVRGIQGNAAQSDMAIAPFSNGSGLSVQNSGGLGVNTSWGGVSPTVRAIWTWFSVYNDTQTLYYYSSTTAQTILITGWEF